MVQLDSVTVVVFGATIVVVGGGSSNIPLFHQGSSRVGLEPVPNLKLILHVSTGKDLALGSEN